MGDQGHKLEYEPVWPRWSLWRWMGEHWRLIGFAVVTIALVWLGAVLPVHNHTLSVCSTCGSRSGEQRLLGIRTSASFVASPLHGWMVQQQRKHAHDWWLLETTDENLFGTRGGTMCGRAPAALHLKLMAEFVRLARPEEIDDLLDALKNGAPAEQERAVDHAFEIAVERLEEQRPGRPGN